MITQFALKDEFPPLPQGIDFINFDQAAELLGIAKPTLFADRSLFQILELIPEGRSSGLSRDEYEVLRVFRNFMKRGRYMRKDSIDKTVQYFRDKENGKTK